MPGLVQIASRKSVSWRAKRRPVAAFAQSRSRRLAGHLTIKPLVFRKFRGAQLTSALRPKCLAECSADL